MDQTPTLAINRPYLTVSVAAVLGVTLTALSATLLHSIIAAPPKTDDGDDSDDSGSSSRVPLEENLGIAAACVAAVTVIYAVMVGISRSSSITSETTNYPAYDKSVGWYIGTAAALAIAGALALAFSVTYIVFRDTGGDSDGKDGNKDKSKDKDKDKTDGAGGAAGIAYALVAVSAAAMIVPGAIIFYSSKQTPLPQKAKPYLIDRNWTHEAIRDLYGDDRDLPDSTDLDDDGQQVQELNLILPRD